MEFVRELIVRFFKPFFVWVGKQHLPYSKKRLKYEEVQLVLQHIRPGDVVLAKTLGELTNWFIPGPYKHGSMYCGNNTIVEAIGKGVTLTNIIDFIMTKDYITVVRPVFCTELDAELAARWALEQQGKPYDYEFKSNNKSFYCFELSYAAYNEVLHNSPWTLKVHYGEPTVIADDFIQAPTKWKEVITL